jgi:hypothetical protein
MLPGSNFQVDSEKSAEKPWYHWPNVSVSGDVIRPILGIDLFHED